MTIYHCRYCHGEIDTETDFNWRKEKKGWYYHEDCYKKYIAGEKYQPSKPKTENQQIHDKAKEYLGDIYNKTLVDNNIQSLKVKYSVDEIIKALDYFYGVQHNDPSKSYGGISIVDYVVDEAKKYYAEKDRIKQQAKKLSATDFIADQEWIKSQSVKATKQKMSKPKHVRYCVLD